MALRTRVNDGAMDDQIFSSAHPVWGCRRPQCIRQGTPWIGRYAITGLTHRESQPSMLTLIQTLQGSQSTQRQPTQPQEEHAHQWVGIQSAIHCSTEPSTKNDFHFFVFQFFSTFNFFFMKLPSETILGTTSETTLTLLLVLNTLVQVLYSICQGTLAQERIVYKLEGQW